MSICVVCGGEFTPQRKNRGQQACSIECGRSLGGQGPGKTEPTEAEVDSSVGEVVEHARDRVSRDHKRRLGDKERDLIAQVYMLRGIKSLERE